MDIIGGSWSLLGVRGLRDNRSYINFNIYIKFNSVGPYKPMEVKMTVFFGYVMQENCEQGEEFCFLFVDTN